MTDGLDKATMANAYARWAPIYDLVFGKVFEHGRMASIEAAERIGGRILEVGVGTGISLLSYKRTNRLVGVDYSEPMLRKAHERVVDGHVTPLVDDYCTGLGRRLSEQSIQQRGLAAAEEAGKDGDGCNAGTAHGAAARRGERPPNGTARIGHAR